MRRPDRRPHGPLWRRLAWFAALWGAGVLSVAIVAFLLRLWL